MYNILNIPSRVSDYTLEFTNQISEIENFIDQINTITIIDSNVNNLYPSLQRETNVIIESNEEAKTLDGASILLSKLSESKANIKTKLVVIGGGVLQDLVGFCASIYSRGIEYILVPTTLLAQTDSCVGGKTSINFESRKNILGTFYPPSKIIIYPGFLNTLNKVDYISGLGEIFKFHILQNKIDQFDAYGNIESMILDGLKYKTDILSRDEFDKGERKFLNYGHTFGHALESVSNHEIPHGLGVILGSIIATRLANKLGYQVNNYDTILDKGASLIKDSKLVLKSEWFDLNKLLPIIKSDKKSTGKLTMVLVDNKPFLADVEEVIILEEILKHTYESI
jgi:3-dehydroquinate synthase